MKKIVLIFLSIIYFLIILFTTIYVLNLDKYSVSKFKNLYFYIDKNDLLIINKNAEIKVNDKVYYYDTFTKKVKISKTKITNIEIINKMETIYTLDNGHLLSNAHLLGNSNCIKIPFIGIILSLISSSLGYLLSIVIPILFILIYFIYKLRKELSD